MVGSAWHALGLVALVSHAKAATADATLSLLTFHYEPESWRLVPEAAGLVVTCLQEAAPLKITSIAVTESPCRKG
jgi:hypothetical protein